MLFRQDALDRIRDGRVSVVFRRWRQARVRAGTRLRTMIGLVEVHAVDAVADVTDDDAARAGYASADALREDIPGDPDRQLFRIEVGFAGADPRIELRADAGVSDEDLATLARMDAGKRGPWTGRVLTLIRDRPAVRAGDIYADAGYPDMLSFKRDVRRLKELGLTESLPVGYRLSPRGEAALTRMPDTSSSSPYEN
jgi:hypothetical protein